MSGTEQFKNCVFYGHMSQRDQATVVPISVIGQYEIIPGYTETFSTGMTFQNTQEFKIEKPGKYSVFWNISFADGNNKLFCGLVMVNGIPDETSRGDSKLGSVDVEQIKGIGLVAVEKDDLVQVGIANHSDTTDPLITASQLFIEFKER